MNEHIISRNWIFENPKHLDAEDLFPYMQRYAHYYKRSKAMADDYRVKIIEPITGKGAMPSAPTEKELACPMLLAKVTSCSMAIRDKQKSGEARKTFKVGKKRFSAVPAAICRSSMGGECPKDNHGSLCDCDKCKGQREGREYSASYHIICPKCGSNNTHIIFKSAPKGSTWMACFQCENEFLINTEIELPRGENPIGQHDERDENQLWINGQLYELGHREIEKLQNALAIAISENKDYDEILESLYKFVSENIQENPPTRRFADAESGSRGVKRPGERTGKYFTVSSYMKRYPKENPEWAVIDDNSNIVERGFPSQADAYDWKESNGYSDATTSYLDENPNDIGEGDGYCGECGEKLTDKNKWSDFTCQKCAKEIGLTENPTIKDDFSIDVMYSAEGHSLGAEPGFYIIVKDRFNKIIHSEGGLDYGDAKAYVIYWIDKLTPKGANPPPRRFHDAESGRRGRKRPGERTGKYFTVSSYMKRYVKE